MAEPFLAAVLIYYWKEVNLKKHIILIFFNLHTDFFNCFSPLVFFQKKNHFSVTLTKFNFLLKSVPSFLFTQWLSEYFQRLNINLFKNRQKEFQGKKKKRNFQIFLRTSSLFFFNLFWVKPHIPILNWASTNHCRTQPVQLSRRFASAPGRDKLEMKLIQEIHGNRTRKKTQKTY